MCVATRIRLFSPCQDTPRRSRTSEAGCGPPGDPRRCADARRVSAEWPRRGARVLAPASPAAVRPRHIGHQRPTDRSHHSRCGTEHGVDGRSLLLAVAADREAWHDGDVAHAGKLGARRVVARRFVPLAADGPRSVALAPLHVDAAEHLFPRFEVERPAALRELRRDRAAMLDGAIPAELELRADVGDREADAADGSE